MFVFSVLSCFFGVRASRGGGASSTSAHQRVDGVEVAPPGRRRRDAPRPRRAEREHPPSLYHATSLRRRPTWTRAARHRRNRRETRLRDETPLRTQEHNDIYVAFLEFFMDLKLNYDVSYETDKIGPTTNPLTDIDDELTREKLPFLYDVAMTMRDGAKPEVQLGIWRLVVDKLIDRTGMSNKEFSVWASRILAEGGSA